MASALVAMLLTVDKEIERLGLHKGDPWLPVNVSTLLEDAYTFYADLPDCMNAISVQVDGDAGVAYNSDLQDWSLSHELRHANAHEWAHIHRKHCGSCRLLRGGWPMNEGFAQWLRGRNERECEIIAAYLLYPRKAYDESEGLDEEYVAARLDIPVHLIEVRKHIVETCGK